MSATQTRSGPDATKSRQTRSGAGVALGVADRDPALPPAMHAHDLGVAHQSGHALAPAADPAAGPLGGRLATGRPSVGSAGDEEGRVEGNQVELTPVRRREPGGYCSERKRVSPFRMLAFTVASVFPRSMATSR